MKCDSPSAAYAAKLTRDSPYQATLRRIEHDLENIYTDAKVKYRTIAILRLLRYNRLMQSVCTIEGMMPAHEGHVYREHAAPDGALPQLSTISSQFSPAQPGSHRQA